MRIALIYSRGQQPWPEVRNNNSLVSLRTPGREETASRFVQILMCLINNSSISFFENSHSYAVMDIQEDSMSRRIDAGHLGQP